MNGLFVHWSRGWGVSSFSERLVGNFLFQEEVKEEDDSDFKSSHKFADHMDKNEAVSDFAKKKTLNQQREYLPVFAVRQEVRISASVCCEARGKDICQYLLWNKS